MSKEAFWTGAFLVMGIVVLIAILVGSKNTDRL